jgi:hypothetical protein
MRLSPSRFTVSEHVTTLAQSWVDGTLGRILVIVVFIAAVAIPIWRNALSKYTWAWVVIATLAFVGFIAARGWFFNR